MLAHYIVCKHSTWIGDFSSGQKLFQCFSTWIGDFSKSHQFEWNACAYFLEHATNLKKNPRWHIFHKKIERREGGEEVNHHNCR